MIRRAVRVAAAMAALLAGTPAFSAPQALSTFDIVMLEDAVADTASRFCIDTLSGEAKLPTPGSATWWQGYKLEEGMPTAAMDALGPSGTSLTSRAILAHGAVTDGDFIVALGGAAGQTCRLIVYRAVNAAQLRAHTSSALAVPQRGWRLLPTSPQYAAANKTSLLLRRNGKPYLANVLAPTTPGAIAMVVTVAAIPPQVTLPPGY